MLAPTLTAAPAVDPERLVEVCGADATLACRKLLEWTGSSTWAELGDFVVGRPLRILVVVVVAAVVVRLARRAIRRGVVRATDPAAVRLPGLTGRRARPGGGGTGDVRALQRAEAVGSVLRSAASVIVWGIAAFTILGEVGIALGPLLASAGIAGVAIGFGAQDLVRDFLSGIFMLAEDQFGVGDIVDVGEAQGVVEGISLRTTRVRDVEGTLWHVPNGEIRRVGNQSQEWARALLDVAVGYGTDLARASAVIKEVADELRADEAWAGVVLDEPEVWGVQELGDSSVLIRLVVRTRPGDQWRVRRELNGRLKARFDAEGIEIPFPQRRVWMRSEEPAATPGSA